MKRIGFLSFGHWSNSPYGWGAPPAAAKPASYSSPRCFGVR